MEIDQRTAHDTDVKGAEFVDWDPERVTPTIEEARYDLFACMARNAGGETFSEDWASWTVTPSGWPNCVFRITPTESSVARLAEQARLGDMPGFVTIRESPATHSLLTKHGFVRRWSTAGMAIELSQAELVPPQVEGFTIEGVHDEETLAEWLEVVSAALFRTHDARIDAYAGMMRAGDALFYLGRLESTPVATSALFPARGVAGIYWVSTLEGYRNRGIGTAMTAVTMVDARSQGFKVAILQASQIGEGVYSRLGFRKLSTIGNYVLSQE